MNLVGILFEKGKNSFNNIHTEFPKMISKLASIYQLKKFVHLSALGIENAKDSIYAQSKLKGEKEILNNFKNTVIVRPSIVYSVDDNFTTQLMTLLGLLPIFPIYYNGKTKFRPIFCSDLTNSITKIIIDDIKENIIEFAGPEEMSFREISIASPIANCTIVEEVGTILPGPASLTSGVKILISDALYRREFFFETIPIKVIFLFLFANCMIFFNSIDSPLLLIKTKISFELI